MLDVCGRQSFFISAHVLSQRECDESIGSYLMECSSVRIDFAHCDGRLQRAKICIYGSTLETTEFH